MKAMLFARTGLPFELAFITLFVVATIAVDFDPNTRELQFDFANEIEDLTNWQSVSCGGRHTCGIKRNEQKLLQCWGFNTHSQTDVPSPEGWESVSAGWMHTCGLQTGGIPSCWGSDRFGQATIPEDVRGVQTYKLRAGRAHTCAIVHDVTDESGQNSGSLKCWGDSSLNKLDAPIGTGWKDLCVGNAHSCAVSESGVLQCWGYNGLDRATVPRPLSNHKWSSVSCKGSHTCALDIDTKLHCWGHSAHNQTTPLFLADTTRTWVSIHTGGRNSCGIRQVTEVEGACDLEKKIPPLVNLACWGDASYGQNNVPERPTGWKKRELCNVLQWREFDSGGYHSCGITIDDANGVNLLRCWGLEDDAQLDIPVAGAQQVTVPTVAITVSASLIALVMTLA